MPSFHRLWKNYLVESPQDELFKIEMIMYFPLTRDIELETLYNYLRAVPGVTRVASEPAEKKSTNIYVELEIKLIKKVLGERTPIQYVKSELIPNIYKYCKGEYRPFIIPTSVRVIPISQKKSAFLASQLRGL